MRRDRESGGLPGEGGSVAEGGCWGRERLGAGGGGERNRGKNCSAQMVRSCGLRGGRCFSTDDQTSVKALMILKCFSLPPCPHLLIAASPNYVPSPAWPPTQYPCAPLKDPAVPFLPRCCSAGTPPCSPPPLLARVCSGCRLLHPVSLLYYCPCTSPLISLIAPWFIDAVFSAINSLRSSWQR